MFRNLGSFVYRRRWWVIGAWLVAVALGVVASGPLSERVTAEFTGSDRIESARVHNRLQAEAPTGGDIAIVVDGLDVVAGPTPIVQEWLGELSAVPEVVSVIDPWSTDIDALAATDGQGALVVASYANGLEADIEHEVIDEVLALAHDLPERIGGADPPTVTVGGEPVVLQEFETQAEEDLLQGEAIAIPIALLAMIFIFGGVRAAGMPLAVAAAGFLTAGIALLGATFVVDTVSVFALNVVSMLGLGLGIDYGLLLVSRFREERGRGADMAQAVETTVATAGVTVLFSALTVAVAVSGMFLFSDPTMTSFAIGGLSAVLFSLVAAVTLLPALLGVVGAKIRPAKVVADGEGRFFRLSKVVQRFALPIVVVVGGALALLAVPFADVELKNGDATALPRSSEARAAALTLAERFPARGADPIVAMADVDPTSPDAAVWLDTVSGLDGVAGTQIRQGFGLDLLVVDVIPGGESQGDVAFGLVEDIRRVPASFTVEVGGVAANTLDTRAMMSERAPIAIGVVVLATLVLLFLMTGSVAIPIKAVVMNVLSLGASFGALVWIFQDGNLSGPLQFDSVGSVDLWIPILIFLFAFGLSMDYEVFLLSRIKEYHDRIGDNDLSVSRGLQSTGRIITSAAFLIVVVFAGFAAGETLTIKQLGVGLALAVIVDAAIVRTLLVPATMKLLGEWNWWAPRPLRRVHESFGLAEPTHGPRPAVASALPPAASEARPTDDRSDDLVTL
jgi:RND superfamily putative drug exporter